MQTPTGVGKVTGASVTRRGEWGRPSPDADTVTDTPLKEDTGVDVGHPRGPSCPVRE